MLHGLFYYKKLKSNNLGRTKNKKIRIKDFKKIKNLNKNSKELYIKNKIKARRRLKKTYKSEYL